MSRKQEESFHSIASNAPEPMGAVMGKVGLVWTGFFAGISLGDWVLIATLTYTVIQIILTIVERVIKPIMAARASRTIAVRDSATTAVSDSQLEK